MNDPKEDQSGKHDELKRLKKKAMKIEADVIKRNIYKRGVFEKLVGFEAAIREVAESTHSDFSKVIEEAGIDDPFKVLNKSIAHWDKMLASSEILPENELIDKLRMDFQLDIRQAADVFVPTDELEYAAGDRKEIKERGGDVNRVSLALETLVHMELNGEKILLDDLEVTVGKIPENSLRTRPYWIIDLKNHNIAILLNNQYANRTFVLGYKSKKELDSLSGLTKEQLKALAEKNSRIHNFVYESAAEFKEELASAVQKVFEGLEMIKIYATYEEASVAVKALGITTESEYNKRYKEDPRLHSAPYKKYGASFISWPDFLGTQHVSLKERGGHFYETCEEASTAAKTLGIASSKDYKKRYKEDPKLPHDPGRYGDSFKGWGDFLGTGTDVAVIRKPGELYQTYEEAVAAVRALGITTSDEYRKRYKEDPRLPSNPDSNYNGVFEGWRKFLGIDRPSNRERAKEIYQTYEEASAAARALGISSQTVYKKRCKEDPRLPTHPHEKYRDKFVGWADFLGTENLSSIQRGKQFYKSCGEASTAARGLGISTKEEYQRRYKEDPRLPSSPNDIYGEQFTGWRDFLGIDEPTSIERSQQLYQTYEEASAAAKALGIRTSTEYRIRHKEDLRLPSMPYRKYRDAFTTWANFLGTK